MPLFQMKSQSQTLTLEAPEADYRAARRVGQYRVGKEAIYFAAFPGTRYIPYGAVSRALTRPTSIPVKGCCGKTLPMVRMRMYYDGEFYQDFMFEKLKDANAALDGLQAARPELPLERATEMPRTI